MIPDEGKIELRRAEGGRAETLAGSLKQYARGKSFPSEEQIAEALGAGLLRRG